MKKYSLFVATLACLGILQACSSGSRQRSAEIQKPAGTAARIETVAPVQKRMPLNSEAKGVITYDTRRSSAVSMRFGGRIERMYVNYPFEPVRKGQKLLEIYSPEIVTVQKEFLYLLASDPAGSLVEASRQKLSLLGLTETQIKQLAETGEASYSLAVYSPYNGYIYEEPAGPAAGPRTETPARLNIREGIYLERGQTVFRVINTERVWAEFTIYPQAVPYIDKGRQINIVSHSNKELKIEAEVDFVQPFYQDGEKFSKVRAYLDNPGNRFMPGQLVTAQFQSRSDSAWWIPVTAVLDLGIRSVVFVKEKEGFQPRVIRTGQVSGKWVEVVSGLSGSDSIAHDGHYIEDSEGFIKTGNHE